MVDFNIIERLFTPETYIGNVDWKGELINCPLIIEGHFDCECCGLTSLNGGPIEVKHGYFDCSYNLLINLIGCPEIVIGDFYCTNSNLNTLEGCIKIAKRSFDCSNNNLLNLKYGPTIVLEDFYCYNNQLISLEGAPSRVHGDFDCTGNPKLSKEEILKYRATGAVIGKIHSDYGEI